MPSKDAELRLVPSVSRWMGRLSPKWFEPQVRALRMWCTWLGSHGLENRPDELIRFQGGASGRDQYRLLDLLQEWVNGLDLRAASKEAYYNYCRSFFLHNRVALPHDPSFKIHSRKPKHVGTLTVEEIRAVLNRCDPCHRAIFTSMVNGGMGKGEVLYWSDNGLASTLEQLDLNRGVIRIDLPGRKRGRGTHPFFTFIGRDGIKALKAWLASSPHSSGAIFLNQQGRPVTIEGLHSYWRRQVLALNLMKKGEHYGKNPHELRDVFRTRFQKSGADGLAAEFFLGHVVDSNEYNKAFNDEDYARSMYIMAEPWINVVTEEPEKIPRAEMDRKMREMREAQAAQMAEVQRRLELLEKRGR
jgi:integrase